MTVITKLYVSFGGCSTHDAVYEPVNLTFRGPYIVIYSDIKTNKMHYFSTLFR